MKEYTEKQKELGEELIYATLEMDTETVKELLEKGAPVNYEDPINKCRAVHIAAGHGDKEIIDVLSLPGWDEPLDLLVRDSRGRLPSLCVAQGTGLGNVMGYAQKIRELEEKQGEERGIIPRMHESIEVDSNNDPDDGPGF